MRKLLLFLHRKFVRADIPVVFDVDYNIDLLAPAERIEIKAGCKQMIERGVLAKIIADRATQIKNTIALEAKDYFDVTLGRVRLAELDKFVQMVKKLSRFEEKTVPDQSKVF